MFTGEQFPTNEATTLFFGISKLFQNKDPSLRQMVYLILKELAGTAEDVIMSTSIIMKDTAVGSDVLYRANAIRALCRIIDVGRRSRGLQCLRGFADNCKRVPQYRVSSDLSRPPLLTRPPLSPPRPWSLLTTSSRLRAMLSGDGRAKHRKRPRHRNHQPGSLVSPRAHRATPSPTRIS